MCVHMHSGPWQPRDLGARTLSGRARAGVLGSFWAAASISGHWATSLWISGALVGPHLMLLSPGFGEAVSCTVLLSPAVGSLRLSALIWSFIACSHTGNFAIFFLVFFICYFFKPVMLLQIYLNLLSFVFYFFSVFILHFFFMSHCLYFSNHSLSVYHLFFILFKCFAHMCHFYW